MMPEETRHSVKGRVSAAEQEAVLYGDDIVYDVAVENGGNKPRADSFDGMGTGRFPAEYRRGGGKRSPGVARPIRRKHRDFAKIARVPPGGRHESFRSTRGAQNKSFFFFLFPVFLLTLLLQGTILNSLETKGTQA